MSGASEAYALFVFPPKTPFEAYIQALPEMMVFINNGKWVTARFNLYEADS